MLEKTSEASSRNKKYEISTDGRTVWVNSAVCLGRFGRLGIDVHKDITEQMARTGTECLFCTHTPTTRADWDLFVVKMKELHGVIVPQKYMPRRFRG
jgi:hypothetical protein